MPGPYISQNRAKIGPFGPEWPSLHINVIMRRQGPSSVLPQYVRGSRYSNVNLRLLWGNYVGLSGFRSEYDWENCKFSPKSFQICGYSPVIFKIANIAQKCRENYKYSPNFFRIL